MSSIVKIGVLHLLPLPGSPSGTVDFPKVLQRALADASAVMKGGMDGFIIENFGDAPFLADRVPPHVPSMMAIVADRLRQIYPNAFIGINVLRNDASAAVAVATAAQADFIRVNVHTGSAWTDQGLIHGQAYKTLVYRKSLGSTIQLAADILVKHAQPAGISDLSLVAKDTFYRGKADIIILTGFQTGSTTDVTEVEACRLAVPQAQIWIGSGVTPSNVANYIGFADGVIVGSYLHEEGDLQKPLSQQRVENICNALRYS